MALSHLALSPRLFRLRASSSPSAPDPAPTSVPLPSVSGQGNVRWHISSRGSRFVANRRSDCQAKCYLDDNHGATVDGAHEESISPDSKQQSSIRSQPSSLYPYAPAHKRGHLDVSKLHTIYYEVFGNPDGKPVVFLHGGPGAGCTERHARFFDPKHYCIVLFDQRGCGKSSPRGCLEENTTWDLVEDVERLRNHLGVTKWLVMGGSWGVTLALAYAQQHPHAVAAIILRGICLLRQQEIDWFYKQGANVLFPFGWERLLSILEASESQDVLPAFYKRLTSDDPHTQQLAAQEWLRWEMGLSFFSTVPIGLAWDGQQYHTVHYSEEGSVEPVANSSERKSGKSTEKNMAGANIPSQHLPVQHPGNPSGFSSQIVQARLECHYFLNRGFLDDNQLLKGMSKIRHIPGVLVHGRYDFVCPLQNAFDLHRVWPEAHLHIVANAGHSMYEPGISRELLRATDEFKKLQY